MEIKYKLYPYPVLSSYSDDYKQGVFETNTDIVRDGYNLCVDFMATLTSTSLKELIRAGKAKYVYHLECAQTGYRKVVETEKISVSHVITSKTVCGKLQICSFVVATEDIPQYSSPEFHDDYTGATFDIEEGCVMAVGKMVTVDIAKNTDDLSNAPSIFSIIWNADPNCHEMLVDMSSRKIVIKLPLNDYYSYKKLNITPQYQPILNSLTVIPALAYVLGHLQKMTPTERSIDNQDSLWYRTLSHTLLTQFDCDIEGNGFDSVDCLELAQKLINDPISEAFRMLTSSFGVSGGDDE